MKPRTSVTTYQLIGGPLDGERAPWCEDEPPREGRELIVRPSDEQLELRAMYRFVGGAWRFCRSWRESE